MDYTTVCHVYFMYRKSVVTLLENIRRNVTLKQLDKIVQGNPFQADCRCTFVHYSHEVLLGVSTPDL